MFGIYTDDVQYGSLLSVIPTVAFTVGTCCSGFSRYFTRQKIQIIICAVIGTPLVAACACLTLENKSTITGLMFTGCFFLGYIEGVGVTASALSLNDQAEIGIGTGVGATMRGVVATLGSTIYVVVLQNRLATTIPHEVPAALVKAGLPVSSIPAFIKTLSTGTFATVPGVTTTIISAGEMAYKQAQVLAYRTVFLTTLAFSGPILILSFFYPNFDNKMSNQTVALLRGRKERAKVNLRHSQSPVDDVSFNGSKGHIQHVEEESQVAIEV